MNKKFAEKLADYASCKPKTFLELQCYKPDNHYEYQRTDEDGDFLSAKQTIELMNNTFVKVLIPYDTDVKDAVRQLKKITKLLKVNPELIELANPDPKQDDIRGGFIEVEDDLPF